MEFVSSMLDALHHFASNVNGLYTSPINFAIFALMLFMNTQQPRSVMRVFREWATMASQHPRPTTIVEMDYLNRSLESIIPQVRKLRWYFRAELFFMVIFLITQLHVFTIIAALSIIYTGQLAGKIIRVQTLKDQTFKALSLT